MEAELRIAVALSRRPRALTTIHQLAKLVGKSYSYTYTAVQRMVKRGMVRLQTVGHASLCTLALSNPQVQSLLAFADSAREDPKITQQLDGQGFRVAAFRVKGKSFLLVSDAVGKPFGVRATVLREADATQWVANLDFSTLEIQCNAAYFWTVVGDTYE